MAKAKKNTDELILEYLSAHGPSAPRDIREATKLPATVLDRQGQALRAAGKIRVTGKTRGTRWVLATKALILPEKEKRRAVYENFPKASSKASSKVQPKAAPKAPLRVEDKSLLSVNLAAQALLDAVAARHAEEMAMVRTCIEKLGPVKWESK